MATIPLTQSNPELCREWHPTLNGDLTPDKVSAGSQKKVWWLGSCGHSWEAKIRNRAVDLKGCGYCFGTAVLSGFNDLSTTNPDLASEWHPTLNGDLTPNMVRKGSGKIVWWLGSCGHSWEAQILSRTYLRTCPYCSGNKVLVGFNDIATTQPDLYAEWDFTKNSIDPKTLSFGSRKKVWWLGLCGHSWEASIPNRVREGGCPFCKRARVLSGFNDLSTTNPDLASEWHPTLNGDLTPDNVLDGSHIKVWWLGACGHEWLAILSSRAYGNKVGCPECSITGYTTSKPGLLYFISNPALNAFKVGITNPDSNQDRLKMFSNRGWEVIESWQDNSGLLIQNVETSFFRWLRRDLGIPRLLDKASMSNARGASETFSDSILTQAEVIAKIEELFRQEV